MPKHALRLTAAGLLALCAVLGMMVGSGVVLGAATPAIGIDGLDSVENGSTDQATLQATDVADSNGVGAYEIEIVYDPAIVSVSASATGSFAVETAEPSSGVLRIVGYTDSLPGPDGTVSLAALDITGESSGTATLDITVEEFTDADANALTYTTSSATVTVTGDSTNPTTTPGSGGDGSGDADDSETTGDPPVTEETQDLTDVNPGADGTTVRFESVSVTEITFDGEATGGTVQIRDHGRSLPETVQSAAGSENVVHAVEITVPPEHEDSPATFRLSVPADALGDTAPTDARVARFVDGSWEFLPTRVISTDGAILFEVQTPGFSVFGVFADQAESTTSDTDDTTSDTDDTTTNTDSDGTTTDTDTTTATSTDDPGSSGEDDGVGFSVVIFTILFAGIATGALYWFYRVDPGE